jgi:hypothetical protein
VAAEGPTCLLVGERAPVESGTATSEPVLSAGTQHGPGIRPKRGHGINPPECGPTGSGRLEGPERVMPES